MDFIVRAALHEESNDGWVWVSEAAAAAKGIVSRDIVKIRRPNKFRAVYVTARLIDKNFRKIYNNDHSKIRTDLVVDKNTVVMSGWYRDALDIRETTSDDDTTGTVELEITKAWFPIWKSLRSACNRPDPNVPLGTRLGVLGTWLGLFGALLGVSTSVAFSCNQVLEIWLWAILFAFAGIASSFVGGHQGPTTRADERIWIPPYAEMTESSKAETPPW